ncbi:BamA/TamA family outer membrane protein [Fluviicola taffensis]|nr:BamA/TamA family outer membrane protein [Fluviicola taffensis]
MPKNKAQFLAYPTVAYSPETSLELGISALYVRYAKGDTNNRLSEINGFAFYTLQNQFGGIIEHAIYSDKNNWFFLGKLKFQSFPLTFYGIGANAPNVKLSKVEALQFQLKERLLHKLYGNFYGGIEFDLHHLGKVRFNDYDTNNSYEKPLGHQGSTNLGIGAGVLYDNRHNVLNVRHGFFSELAFLYYGPQFGSKYEFSTIYSDIRWFHPIRKRNVLALHAVGQFSMGNPPFNQLALLGGESIMRGYYLGRFRDRNLIAAQAEYRMLPFSFAKRWGATFFASTGFVYNTFSSVESNHLLIAGGAGLRFLLFRKKDVWVRLDVAFTKEGQGFYIFIGEAF